jgi:hypothetical protein
MQVKAVFLITLLLWFIVLFSKVTNDFTALGVY